MLNHELLMACGQLMVKQLAFVEIYDVLHLPMACFSWLLGAKASLLFQIVPCTRPILGELNLEVAVEPVTNPVLLTAGAQPGMIFKFGMPLQLLLH